MQTPAQRRMLIVASWWALGLGLPAAAHGEDTGQVAVLLGECRVPALQGELVTNGGVELSSRPSGPTGWDNRGIGQEQASWDDQRAATGARSLKLAQADEGRVGAWRQYLPAPPAGVRLHLQATVSAELDPGSAVVLECSGLGTPNPRVEVVRDDIGPEWTRVETDVTVGERAGQLLIRAALRGTGVAWFDDFSLTPITDSLEPTTKLDVLLPLPPANGLQIPVAVRLGVRPKPPACVVTVERDPGTREALRVRLPDLMKRDYEFGWSTLVLLASVERRSEVLHSAIRPTQDLPETVLPFLSAGAPIIPNLPGAEQLGALLNQAASYLDVAALSQRTTADMLKAPGAFDWRLAWHGKDGEVLRGQRLTAAMFRMRGVPARVTHVIPLLTTRGPGPNTSYQATEVHVSPTGWVPLPLHPEAEAWPLMCVLDVLPPGENRSAETPWDWRPARLVNAKASPAPSADFGWAAFSVHCFRLSADELAALQVPAGRMWQQSLDELIAGAPPATCNAFMGRLRDVKSADELAAALAE